MMILMKREKESTVMCLSINNKLTPFVIQKSSTCLLKSIVCKELVTIEIFMFIPIAAPPRSSNADRLSFADSLMDEVLDSAHNPFEVSFALPLRTHTERR